MKIMTSYEDVKIKVATASTNKIARVRLDLNPNLFIDLGRKQTRTHFLRLSPWMKAYTLTVAMQYSQTKHGDGFDLE